MPIFSVNMKHTPESCAMFNEEVKKKFKEAVRKREEVGKKHEVKVLSATSPVLEHFIFYVVEAPSYLAVEDYFKEIGFAFWNDFRVRQVEQVEDVLKKIEAQ